ncbi:helix-turn-helix transcriptional regulator [Arthrobacter sp. ISL-30]|uniref:ArsR/SmtB family transcription factor n=1 Tax=Arthrobacter sp. ISL-30 TaxID=2819109 RepID=UPI001BEB5742|nr:metalloregulator ArsR/SmtB family transcription factor [Arthrobacter sp. ISL-30]MBT2513698.1 winged helix-turn-helix transcriptional regulator [Arthrobacter sp. ISL-30]
MKTLPLAGSEQEDRLNRAFMALSDPLRRRIVARLAQGDATVNELAEPFSVTVQAVSKHLQVLEAAGLVTRRKEAQRRPCHLNTSAMGPLAAWIDSYRLMAEERFQRLDELLESQEKEEKSS